MPEMSDIIPWDHVSWDNMSKEWKSGESNLKIRPYYFRRIGKGNESRILIISAVPSKSVSGHYHATDYLRLDQKAFQKLLKLGAEAFKE